MILSLNFLPFILLIIFILLLYSYRKECTVISKKDIVIFRWSLECSAKGAIATKPHQHLCPVHTAPFLYKSALRSGYLHKRRLSSNAVDSVNPPKMDICLDHSTVEGLKPQKRISFLRCCEQCESTKTDISIWIFIQKRSSMNG